MPTDLEFLGGGKFKGAVLLRGSASAVTPNTTGDYFLQVVGTSEQFEVTDSTGMPTPMRAYTTTEGFFTIPSFAAIRANNPPLLGLQRLGTALASGGEFGILGGYGPATTGLVLSNRAEIAFRAAAAWANETSTPSDIALRTTPSGDNDPRDVAIVKENGDFRLPLGGLEMVESTQRTAVANEVTLQAVDVNGETKIVAVMPNGVVIPVAHGEVPKHDPGWLRPLNSAQTTKAIAETMSRADAQIGVIASSLSTGVMHCTTFPLYKGQVVNALSYCAGAALAGGTNQWFALYKYEWSGGTSAHTLKAISASDGSTAWGANSIKTLAMTTPYTVLEDGIYISAIMVQGTTPPTLMGNTNNANVNGKVPHAAFTTGSGLTNPASAPSTISSITQNGSRFWSWAT